MSQKIFNILGAIGFGLSLCLVGTSVFTYKYLTSVHFKAKIQNYFLADLKKTMPSVIRQQIPTYTGKSILVREKKK
tara:strand:- start:3 stop:230 length:228 start_codon:yes stop_codon:yes gene_type:complete